MDALLDCCMDCVLFVIVRSLMIIADASVCFYRVKLFCFCGLLFWLLCYVIVSYSFYLTRMSSVNPYAEFLFDFPVKIWKLF